jgi:ectoine hydroxylase-related dioxygenase (phytanoyl-CoA dioxygenase family)
MSGQQQSFIPDRAAFERDGLVVVRDLFTAAEMQLLSEQAATGNIGDSFMQKQDRSGNPVNLAMWNQVGEDIFGRVARNERLVDAAEHLLGETVYLYSAKMTMKDARQGGAWEWHQDYGYWYHYGCLRPAMLSAYLAVDRATRENGCLQVLRGSHLMGRIDHLRDGEQNQADPERVEVALQAYERVWVELACGDAVFFHCNLLHYSDANLSDARRWGFICSYNAVSNRPFKRVREYGNFTPLVKVPADAVLARPGSSDDHRS